ncbi:MAG: glycosyltransferase family 2 protein [Caldisphaeraceae archaeon]|nr:glycosyltransferase family 2 protein [Caldisphaeraceae archaeon]
MEPSIIYIAIPISFVSFFLALEIAIYVNSYYIVKRDPPTDPAQKVMALPKVSIIVPAYKEGKNIVDALGSISRLNYPRDRLEAIIAMEEGDTKTLSHLKEAGIRFGEKYTIWNDIKVRIVFNRGIKGKPSSLNEAVKESEGDIIGICDADDILERNIAIEAVRYIKSGFSAVQFARHIINTSGIIEESQQGELEISNNYFSPSFVLMGKVPPLLGSGYFIEKKALVDVGLYNIKAPTEDLDLTIKLAEKGYRITFINKKLVYTRAVKTLWELVRQRERWVRGAILLIGRAIKNAKRLWPLLSLNIMVPLVGVFGQLLSIASLVFIFRPRPILVILDIPLFISILSYLIKYITIGKKVRSIPVLYAAYALAEWATIFNLLTNPWKWTKTRKV